MDDFEDLEKAAGSFDFDDAKYFGYLDNISDEDFATKAFDTFPYIDDTKSSHKRFAMLVGNADGIALLVTVLLILLAFLAFVPDLDKRNESNRRDALVQWNIYDEHLEQCYARELSQEVCEAVALQAARLIEDN